MIDNDDWLAGLIFVLLCLGVVIARHFSNDKDNHNEGDHL
jgi:hypothetical protein